MHNRIDSSAEVKLRSLPPDTAQRIMATIRLRSDNTNPSAALMAFIRKDQSQGQRPRGGRHADRSRDGHRDGHGHGQPLDGPSVIVAHDRCDDDETLGSAWGGEPPKAANTSKSEAGKPGVIAAEAGPSSAAGTETVKEKPAGAGGAEDADDESEAGVEPGSGADATSQFLASSGVNAEAGAAFRALPPELRKRIVEEGSLHGFKDASAELMSRIRCLEHPGGMKTSGSTIEGFAEEKHNADRDTKPTERIEIELKRDVYEDIEDDEDSDRGCRSRERRDGPEVVGDGDAASATQSGAAASHGACEEGKAEQYRGLDDDEASLSMDG